MVEPSGQAYTYMVGCGIVIIMHLGRRVFDQVVLLAMLIVGTAGFAFGFYIASKFHYIPYSDLVGVVILYSVYLFVLLSEVLLWGLAAKLTRWRGENWTKELDYFYIGLAGIGLVVSINKLQIIADKITFPDVYGPMILSTALVVRAIKARAEINGWNRSK